MSLIHRRHFLKSCGIGAAGILGLDVLAPKAQANWRYSLAARNFTAAEATFIGRTMRLLSAHFTSHAVYNEMSRVARASLVDNAYARAIGMPANGAWSAACFGYQLAYYLRRHVPRVQFRGYYSRENYAARADVGVVRTLDITRRTGRIQGEFIIHVNRHSMGQQLNNPIGWAGVFAHEMMHSLGHLHGHNEYGNHLQINAIVPAIIQACTPRVAPRRSGPALPGASGDSEHSDEILITDDAGPTTHDYEEITRNQRYCGCSAR